MSRIDDSRLDVESGGGAAGAISGWVWDNDLSGVPDYEFDALNSSGGIIEDDFVQALATDAGALTIDASRLYLNDLNPGDSFFGRIWISDPLDPRVMPELALVINHPDTDRNGSASGGNTLYVGFTIVRTEEDGETEKLPPASTDPRVGFFMRPTPPATFLDTACKKFATGYTNLATNAVGPYVQAQIDQSAHCVGARFLQTGLVRVITASAVDASTSNDFETITAREYDRPEPVSDRWRLALEIESVAAPATDQYLTRVEELYALGVSLAPP